MHRELGRLGIVRRGRRTAVCGGRASGAAHSVGGALGRRSDCGECHWGTLLLVVFLLPVFFTPARGWLLRAAAATDTKVTLPSLWA